MKTIDNRIAKTLVLVVSLILSFPVFGQNADAVDLRLASRVGENFIRLNGNIALSGEPGSLRRVETDKFPNLYIFNADEHGFVIVAGDKRVQPILGFSDEGTFDPNDMAPAAEMIIGGYDYVVDSMVRYNVRSTDESVRQAWIDLENGYYRESKGKRDEEPEYPLAVSPLITTYWNQGKNDDWSNNYNQFCPWTDVNGNGIIDDNDYRAIAGCAATAMAQLLYYFKVYIPSHEINCRLYNKDSQTYYLEDKYGNIVSNDGNNHKFDIGGWDYSKSNSKELAAKLMIDCGLTVGMEYGLEGSGSYFWSSFFAFKNHFGFNDADWYLRMGHNKKTWEIILKRYICHEVPLYYRGAGPHVFHNHEYVGHEYILDGYLTDNNYTFFHHNLGWKRNNSAYYSIDYIFPDAQFCIGLVPVNDDIHIERTINFGIDCTIDTCDKNYIIRYGEAMSVTNNYIDNNIEYEKCLVYSQPGVYRLYDKCDDGTNIFIKVLVKPNPANDISKDDEVCRGQQYSNRFQDQSENVYYFILPLDLTDYEGTRTFYEYVTNDIDGSIIGRCALNLTTILECDPNCTPEVSCLDNSTSGDKDGQTTNQIIYESVTKYYEYMHTMKGFLSKVLMEAYWFDKEKGVEFWNLFQSLLDSNTGLISEEGIQQLISQSQLDNVSDEYIRIIAEGYNQSVMYWNEGYYTNESLPEGYGGIIEYDTAAMQKAYEAQAYAESLGFSDVRQMYDNAYEMLESEIENQQTSVCARITVKFTQKLTMTREAFNGTLQIFNGHESIPMQNILVDFMIKDAQGNDCTNLFQINTLSLDQITGISGDGSLAAQTNGTALVQFIPTKNAAPTQPVVYSFGGSFSFIDPFTGEGLTYPLYPVDITVNPSPDLYVDYFMQRDILGDDALTLDVVEPSVPAELGVIIHNQGAGMAKNVTLETAEPQIIDNEKGLAIDFAMYGASFNGSPRQLGLTEIPFGNIESGQTAVGEWLFTSSLLGHFVSYTAHVIHNSSYGNSDLSLVSHLDIHELVHPIYAYGNLDDGINDFLVNDNPDAYDTPDSIYFSHGGKTSVGVVDGISFDHYVSPSDTIVTLTVVPSRIGWNYGVTDDPGMNQYDIVSCIRNNDNQEIPLNNVWLTFVTIPDGGDPVYENKLHIVDTIPVGQTTTYTLVYTKSTSQNNSMTQSMTLAEGWNWWSSYIDLSNDGLEQLEAALSENGVCIKSQYNGFVMNNSGHWDGSLAALDNKYMYRIQMNEADVVAMNGIRINPAHVSLSIQPGWNWVGYPIALPLDMETVFSNYEATANDIIKGMRSFAIYYEGYGWIPTTFLLIPGQGYMYKSLNTSAQTLTFADGRSGFVSMAEEPTYWQANVHAFADNLNIVAIVMSDGEELREEGVELGAFVNDECRGSAKLYYVEPIDRYIAFLTVTGQDGEQVEFRLINHNSAFETEKSCNHIDFQNDAVFGSLDQPFPIHFGTMNDLTEMQMNVSVYPNPVDRNTPFILAIPEGETVTEVWVVNAMGETVSHETGQLIHSMIHGLPITGVYMVKVTCKSGNVYISRVVVK